MSLFTSGGCSASGRSNGEDMTVGEEKRVTMVAKVTVWGYGTASRSVFQKQVGLGVVSSSIC